MKATSNGRVIRIALAASLAVHFIVATFVHPPRVEAQPQENISPAIIVHITPPKPTPPPRIVHPKQQTRSQSLSRRPIVHMPRITPRRDNTKSVGFVLPSAALGTPEPTDTGTSASGPDTGPTGTPEPTATPKPACSAPDVPAHTTFVQSPAVPETVPQTGTTAKIRVDLDAEGNVRSVSLYESTGSMELDQAALAAARQSRYAAEEINCKNAPGSYLFTVDFSQ